MLLHGFEPSSEELHKIPPSPVPRHYHAAFCQTSLGGGGGGGGDGVCLSALLGKRLKEGKRGGSAVTVSFTSFEG